MTTNAPAAASNPENSHNAPITKKEQDWYERWSLATSISKMVEYSPPEWATRIGVYGPWGSGKTSLLNLVIEQQKAKKNIIIQFTPWSAKTDGEMWRSLAKATIDGLKQSGMNVGCWTQIKYWARLYFKPISLVVKIFGEAAQLTGHAPGAKFITRNLMKFCAKIGIFSSANTVKIPKTDKRVIVVVDDLDRTAPELLPGLLLSLRELLDMPGFSFLLAFDKDVVSAALHNHNPAWKAKDNDFLEKIIDFQVYFSNPTKDQVLNHAIYLFSTLCPLVPAETVKAYANVLPTNPRRLKLLVRTISSMSGEIRRHKSGELNFDIIVLFSIIQIEAPSLAALIQSEKKFESNGLEQDWFRWARLEPKKTDEFVKELMAKLVKLNPQLASTEAKVSALAPLWMNIENRINSSMIAYLISFFYNPPNITWGEFEDFITAWRSDKDYKKIETFILARIDSTDRTKEQVEIEFAKTIGTYYANILEKAADEPDRNEHTNIIQEAMDALVLLEQSFFCSDKCCEVNEEVTRETWLQLKGCAARWCHFRANEKEKELREKEVSCLIKFSKFVDSACAIYLSVAFGNFASYDQNESQIAKTIFTPIIDSIEQRVIDELLKKISTPYEMTRLAENRGRENEMRPLFQSTASPLFFDKYKGQLLDQIHAMKNHEYAHLDCDSFLHMLTSPMEYGGAYCGPNNLREFVNRHAELVILLWNTSISRARQFRFLSALREKRSSLIGLGLAPNLLNEPEWLVVPPEATGPAIVEA
ncbi:KAP family P-loop NTPase fold protein [Silvimonas soli]|uniref:KAP family P-loop NTPase fold protein n=1 Tax=Silvimonas soli TaxID=2980100 RepID=UPI0024B359A9|nr:P-loop NTPase fold protein [Silvimonas soli]